MVEPRSRKELSHSIDMILARGEPRRGSSAGVRDQNTRPTETPTPEGTRVIKSPRVMRGHHPRVRTTFSAEQLQDLEEAFQAGRYPSAQAREQLASHTHLSETKIQIWFQNRRARWRRSNAYPAPCGSSGSQPDTPTHVPPPLPPHWLPPTNRLPVPRTAFLAVGPGYSPVSAHLRPLALGTPSRVQHPLQSGPWPPHARPQQVWVSTGTLLLQGHAACV
ncbi:unnamed protein product [Lota lota]